MRIPVVLCGFSLFCAAAAAQAHDYRALNDCMAGEFQTSIEVCTRLIERGGHDAVLTANLYTLRGYAHGSAEERYKAIADFDRAIQLAPQSYGAYQLRSLIYQTMGENDRAQADLKQALALQKEAQQRQLRDPIQSYCMAIVLQAWGTTLAAISGYTLAIEADPRLAAAYLKRAEVYGVRRELHKALADLDKAIDLDADYSAAYLRRAQGHEQGGKLDKALGDFAKAIALNPRYSFAHYGRATA